MVTIANDFLTVNISRHGAELTSIKDNLTGRDSEQTFRTHDD